MKTTRAKKEQGVKLGSPKGTGKSKLDKFKPKNRVIIFLVRHNFYNPTQVLNHRLFRNILKLWYYSF